jgi:NAD(P)H-hydrate repair Nnr-like enzyme with NAD(P)H-hydrate dehydratase domain
MVNGNLLSTFKTVIPKLTQDLHKGQSGRVGILGGSKE